MKKRILVVDDPATIRHQVMATLSSAGFEVVEAVDGRTSPGNLLIITGTSANLRPMLEFAARRHPAAGRGAVLTPQIIRDAADLRRIFERKMEGRQEMMSRESIFRDDHGTSSEDWHRTHESSSAERAVGRLARTHHGGSGSPSGPRGGDRTGSRDSSRSPPARTWVRSRGLVETVVSVVGSASGFVVCMVKGVATRMPGEEGARSYRLRRMIGRSRQTFGRLRQPWEREGYFFVG